MWHIYTYFVYNYIYLLYIYIYLYIFLHENFFTEEKNEKDTNNKRFMCIFDINGAWEEIEA